ncbi:MAG TPA: glycosyltransferase family 4 protein [Bacteroidales bacterium]|jgi:glycosyltransferase involved in cell wall biosynthesis|nr:glycosyltransferase family 4 protein [Bacteroidales bacterium]HQK71808.1 glycosyltransferase family 4 protein [Bacteroidales bacterium]
MSSDNRNKLFIIVQLPPPVHGASVMNSNVVNSRVIRENFDTIVLNLQFLTSIKEITRFSIRKIAKAFSYSFELAWKIHTVKPDLIYFSFSPKGYSFYRDTLYVFIIKSFRKKLVIHLHGQGVKENQRNNFLRRRLYKAVFRDISVICLSEKLLYDIEDVYDGKPYIVPNGIEPIVTNKLKPIRSSSEISQILCISNYMLEKGIPDLIEAFKIIHDQGFIFSAKLVGAPIDLSIEDLKQQVEKLHLADCIKISGPLYGQEKVNVLLEADIFVLPSRNEAFPLVILEAMQCGLPVVATCEGGIPDMIIENETGLLVEKENPHKLAESIIRLIENKRLRITMGENGLRRFREYYSLEKFETNILSTLNSIIESRV